MKKWLGVKMSKSQENFRHPNIDATGVPEGDDMKRPKKYEMQPMGRATSHRMRVDITD